MDVTNLLLVFLLRNQCRAVLPPLCRMCEESDFNPSVDDLVSLPTSWTIQAVGTINLPESSRQ